MERIKLSADKNNFHYYISALSIKKSNHLINQDAFAINNIISNQELETQFIKINLLNNCSIAVSDGVSQSRDGSDASLQAVTLFNNNYCFKDINTLFLKNNISACTLAALTFDHDLAVSQSIGDSAIILVRNNHLKTLTFDQDFKSRLYLLTNEKTNLNILEHYLPDVNFEANSINKNIFKIKNGDCFYVVSDGYKMHLSSRKFKKLIKKNKLIKYFQSYQRKFNDDTTIIKIEIRGDKNDC